MPGLLHICGIMSYMRCPKVLQVICFLKNSVTSV